MSQSCSSRKRSKDVLSEHDPLRLALLLESLGHDVIVQKHNGERSCQHYCLG